MARTKKIYATIFSALFLCLISYSLLNDLFNFYTAPKASFTENRFMAKKPTMELTNMDAFPMAYSNFFNDDFPFRSNLLAFNSGAIVYSFFQRSPYPALVHLGKDGWMYFAIERKFYDGSFTLTADQISQIVQELHKRAVYYTSKGIKFYLIIPLMKNEIYPEYLPPDYFRSPTGTNTDSIIAAIKKDTLIGFIDLKEPLLNAKKFGRLYYKTDNHWNFLGGFYGYTEIMNRMKKDFPSLKPLTFDDLWLVPMEIYGKNLANIMGISKFIKEEDHYVKFKKPRAKEGILAGYIPRPDFGYPNEYEIVKVVPDTTLPKIVVIRDSFLYGIMPYLNESFSRAVYIYDTGVYAIHEEVIEKEKPDIVLDVIFEIHLHEIIGVKSK